MTRMISTFFYVGLLSPASGTWGSLAALPLFWLLHVMGGPLLAVASILILGAVGSWSALIETQRLGLPDPGEIVVDEVVGQWIALLPLSIGAARVNADILALWPGWVAGFVLFRAFDIIKPGPVGWAEGFRAPIGIMLDDIIAGLLAAICVVILAALAHIVLV